MIGGVVIQFRADADKARRDVDKLSKSISGVDSSASRAGGGLSKLAKAGIAGLVGGVVLGAAALYDFAKAAAEDWQEAEKLARTLKKVPGVTNAMVEANAKWIDSMEIATGIADSDLRNSIARLAVATGDLSKAQTLATLAADMSIGRNISLATATQMLEKAAGGNTTALKRQMPWLDANHDGTISMTEAVKGLTKAYGGAAKKAADNNPWVRIQAVWSQMKEALGQFILPSLEKLATWFKSKKNQKALQGWIEKVGEFSRTLGEKLAKFITETLMPALGKLIDWFKSPEGQAQIANMTAQIMTMVDALAKVAKAVEVVLGWLGRLAAHDTEVKTAMGSAANNGLFQPTLQAPANMSIPGTKNNGNTYQPTIVIHNPKPEPASTSIAAAQRTAQWRKSYAW